MVVGDELYNTHFRFMVTEGLICGLMHPVEWLVSYSRGMGLPYDRLPEIDEFVSLASKELYGDIHMIPKESIKPKDIQGWIDRYYKKGVESGKDHS